MVELVINIYSVKHDKIKKVLCCAMFFFASTVFASPELIGFNNTHINVKPFSALWDRLTTFEYPHQDDAVVASWRAGQWQAPGISGYYQLILTESENRSNRLYVQWLYLDPVGNLDVAYSMSVTDINQLGQYFIERSECDVPTVCDLSRVRVTHRYEDFSFGLGLDVVGLGHYRLKVEYF